MNTIITDTLEEAFAQLGMPFPRRATAGKFVRFSTNGKRRDKAGWLRLFPDENSAIFGDWRSGEVFVWHRHRGQRLTRQEFTAFKEKVRRQQMELKAKQEAAYAKTVLKAQSMQQAAHVADPCYPYFLSKRVKPHGLQQLGSKLLIPIFSGNQLVNLQLISPDGKKHYLKGGQIKGCYSPIGNIHASNIVYICEGWATGATIHQITGHPVACAMSCGNIVSTAIKLHRAYPNKIFVICGDDDRFTQNNPGRHEAYRAARAIGCTVDFPSFPEGSTGTDFNDMAIERGLL